ncbi:hypothetical protein A3G14_01440 [Candidatus Curtissbacteria bacterium RIFCSPLOWO2_12_FULL_38_9]|nr:MAG: hypothetical protein A3G14_01440 [Candidatus Curtissbacteria bacterium RIFCSPLOWO2_12_FULL_38_9]
MKLKILQFLHLIIFLAGITIVVILHIKTTNFWDFLRLPKLIVDLDPFFGSGWPASLHVYQAILVFAMIVALINGLGTFFYRRKIWRMLSDLLSFLGVLIIWPASLFLLYTLASAENLDSQNIQTIVIYFGLTLFIAALDLVTWFVDEKSFIKRTRMH